MSTFTERLKSLKSKCSELAHEFAELADDLRQVGYEDDAETVNGAGYTVEQASEELDDAVDAVDAEEDEAEGEPSEMYCQACSHEGSEEDFTPTDAPESVAFMCPKCRSVDVWATEASENDA